MPTYSPLPRLIVVAEGNNASTATCNGGKCDTPDDAEDFDVAKVCEDRRAELLESNREIASAKVYATEMLARVTDEAIQIFGGMGLMDELPLERFWRDSRVERIWDGTSEIQRHIISRDLLRPLGG